MPRRHFIRRGAVRAAIAAPEDLPFSKFVPNGLTLLGLCSGATSIRFALAENWKAAVFAIVLATIFDLLDGRMARLMKADSKFGAQLDSLSDLVSFGIAPSVLVYLWSLSHAGGAGWTLCLMFCACAAIRLARFNIESTDESAAKTGCFVGMPTPIAACLALLPMILSFQFTSDTLFRNPLLGGALVAGISLMMVSRIPTPSLKHLRIPKHLKLPLAGFVGLVLGFAVLWPWATLTSALIMYVLMLPFGGRFAHHEGDAADEPPSAE
ncbi:MAG: CDP-diacylglycerol--serine O-phosphatidyltransferase [Alphaproteobacteria bacterium]|nr:CDP-diacylglycerol--serine O-phosphatidyltransferase [Alphaproteobacteria bacterium]